MGHRILEYFRKYKAAVILILAVIVLYVLHYLFLPGLLEHLFGSRGIHIAA